MGIVHDFGELISGDYTPHDKLRDLMELWQEYEDRKTPEALWLYDADKMESRHTNLEEFLGLIPKFTTPQRAAWGRVLHEEIQQGQIHRQHIPIIFVTGLPSIDKTTHSKLLSKEVGALYLSLSDILAQRSADPADPEADFAALYLQKGPDTSPIGYMTDLLKENIDEGIKQGKRCVVVDGFPRSVKQLRGFEEKIQKGNLTLLLTSLRDLEDQPKQLFKKIDCDGSEEGVYVLLKEAAETFIEQAGK
ncbi:hypothetical protein V8E51_005324 [Hyaloscypha variabilis]